MLILHASPSNFVGGAYQHFAIFAFDRANTSSLIADVVRRRRIKVGDGVATIIRTPIGHYGSTHSFNCPIWARTDRTFVPAFVFGIFVAPGARAAFFGAGIAAAFLGCCFSKGLQIAAPEPATPDRAT
jgi:membrane-bound metal-dependent hydrolase YbcI (DUF457 family)